MARIVFLAPDDLPVPPTSGGSVQIYLHNLLPKLAELTSVEPWLISPGRQPMPSISHIPILARQLTYRGQALRALKRIHPDVVQIENRPSLVPLVKRSAPRAKVVLNLHSLTFLQRGHINAEAARAVLRRADAVTLNSRSLRRAIERKFRMKSGTWNPTVIYPGVPSDRFRHPTSGSRALPSGEHSMVQPSSPSKFSNARPLSILYVGRVIRQKGVHTLIEAVRILHKKRVPVQLTIIGRTPPWEASYATRIRHSVRGLPIRIRGFVPPSKLPRHYWKADILVCPSQGHEAFGLVNVEAMAAGLPVVGSKQGGIAEIVSDACGILVTDYRRPEAFAAAIRRFVDDPSLLPRLREGAIRQSSKFSWRASAEQFAQLYRRL